LGTAHVFVIANYHCIECAQALWFQGEPETAKLSVRNPPKNTRYRRAWCKTVGCPAQGRVIAVPLTFLECKDTDEVRRD